MDIVEVWNMQSNTQQQTTFQLKNAGFFKVADNEFINAITIQCKFRDINTIVGNEMKLKKAIEVLEQHKSTAEKFKMTVGTDKISEAIDTVVEAFEDNSDDMCYHECHSCGSRCNCNDQPCSCCQEKTYTAKDIEPLRSGV
jgi:hypothetical protein